MFSTAEYMRCCETHEPSLTCGWKVLRERWNDMWKMKWNIPCMCFVWLFVDMFDSNWIEHAIHITWRRNTFIMNCGISHMTNHPIKHAFHMKHEDDIHGEETTYMCFVCDLNVLIYSTCALCECACVFAQETTYHYVWLHEDITCS
jgi:hypothetical protein